VPGQVTPSMVVEIRIRYNQLTRAEKKVADYVLGNVDKVLFMSITDLAEACGVAEASVHRFCRDMGAKGYQEFKMKLSLDQQDRGREENSREETPETQSPFFESILKSHLDAIRETYALLDPDEVNRVVKMMTEAKSIHFFGIGDSLLAAEEARNKFLRITPKVITITDPHMQAIAAAMCTKDDLMFFISYSGSTRDNVYVAKIAKACGARIVVITRFLKSPLTEFADAVLICGSKEGPLEGGSMGAKMSQLHIIDILFQTYFTKTKRQSRENNRKTAQAVADKLF